MTPAAQRQALADAVTEGFGLAFGVEYGAEGHPVSSAPMLNNAARFATCLRHALGSEIDLWLSRFTPGMQPRLLASDRRIEVAVGEFAHADCRPSDWPAPSAAEQWPTTGAAFSFAVDCRTPFSRYPNVEVAMVLRDASLEAMRRTLRGIGGHYVRSAIREGKLSLHGYLSQGAIRVDPARAVEDLEGVLNTSSSFRATEVSLVRVFNGSTCTVARVREAMVAVDKVRALLLR